MGQKVNPHGLRVGVIKNWDAKWYAGDKEFGDVLVEDNKIRKFLKNKLYASGVSKIETERAAGRLKVTIYTAKPGVVIGKGGAAIDELKQEIQNLTSAKVILNILEVRRPECDAQLVAENVAQQLENRVSFRRAMKQAMGRSMKAGAKGIKIMVAGRVGGARKLPFRALYRRQYSAVHSARKYQLRFCGSAYRLWQAGRQGLDQPWRSAS